MKRCPKCDHRYDDNLTACPSCGADYIEASISSIAGGGESDSEQPAPSLDSDDVLLQAIESELAALNNIVPPTLKESFARMASVVWGAATAVTLIAAILLAAPIFYIVAAILLALFILAVIRRNGGLSRGEADVKVISRIYNEDVARMKPSFKERGDVEERLTNIKGRIEASERSIEAAHAKNRKVIVAIAAVVGLLFIGGVVTLAVMKAGANKAEAEYAAQPEWIIVRNAYLESEYNDEHRGAEARKVVVMTMLDADMIVEAEKFFMEHCMGTVGDYDCAREIVNYYDTRGSRDLADMFIDGIELRYPSDNQKIRAR